MKDPNGSIRRAKNGKLTKLMLLRMWKTWNSHILLMRMYIGTKFLAVSTKAEHLQKHTIPFLGTYIQKICVSEYSEIHRDYS